MKVWIECEPWEAQAALSALDIVQVIRDMDEELRRAAKYDEDEQAHRWRANLRALVEDENLTWIWEV